MAGDGSQSDEEDPSESNILDSLNFLEYSQQISGELPAAHGAQAGSDSVHLPAISVRRTDSSRADARASEFNPNAAPFVFNRRSSPTLNPLAEPFNPSASTVTTNAHLFSHQARNFSPRTQPASPNGQAYSPSAPANDHTPFQVYAPYDQSTMGCAWESVQTYGSSPAGGDSACLPHISPLAQSADVLADMPTTSGALPATKSLQVHLCV
jgi:hypothetical protein